MQDFTLYHYHKNTMETNQTEEKIVKRNIWFLLLFAVISVVIWQLPYGNIVLYPFTILGTWFHEMGHGLTALFLGGRFHELQIFSNGSGLAQWSGDVFLGNVGKAMVAAGGPVGPIIAGGLMLIASKYKKSTKFVLFAFSLIMLLSILLWVRTWFGFGFLLLFSALIILISVKGKERLQMLTLQFLAVQAFLSIYLTFGYLFSEGGQVAGTSYLSDTAFISQYLFLPHWFWAVAILLLSLIIMYFSIRITFSKGKQMEKEKIDLFSTQ